MTPKQRFISAMNFRQPEDYVAFMELEFQLCEDITGTKLIVGHEYEKLTSLEKEQALHKNAEVLVKTAEMCGHDVIRNIGGYWEISPGEPAFIWLPDEESQIEQLNAIKKMAGDRYFILGSAGAATMGIPDGNHIYEFVVALYDNPEDVKSENETKLNKAVRWGYKQLDNGADAIINCCDVAFNNGPFISPQLMDEFFFPYFNRWVDSLKSQGVITIWHTDGNILPLMDRILESGVAAIQCIDPIADMDIVDLKRKVEKKLALIGNIDCALLQLGPEEEIEAEVKRVVEGCKNNGGFALCGCNAIFKGIPARHYQIMVDARYKYGKY